MTKEQKENIASIIIAVAFAASLGFVFADNLYNWYKSREAEKQKKEIKQQRQIAKPKTVLFINNQIKSK
jgi:Sec-independent protein secretion pathway component TatC